MKTTVNKTIPFKQRDEDKKNVSSKYRINTSKDNSSSKVIRYPKYKKKKDKGIKIVKKNKFIFIILAVIMFFSLISFIDNNLLKDKYGPNKKPIKAQASSTLVSETEFHDYSNIVESEIRSTLKLSSEHKVITNTMHKNGSYISSQGDVSLGKNDVVHFDAILKDKKFTYLVIDGTEYIK